jgi:short-subunit dehydrogenase
VNVSSVGGRMVFPLGGAYHATKYAVEAMSDALRMELAQFGIRVSLIEPGYVKTEFTTRTMDLLGKYSDRDTAYRASLQRATGVSTSALERFAVGPASVSRAIAHASTKSFTRARYVAPFYNGVGPWMVALTPTWLVDLVLRTVTGLGGRRPTLALPAPAKSTNGDNAIQLAA